MLTSKKIELRRSEIRQELATLAANDNPSEDETRAMQTLDAEYRTQETRYRAAVISEAEERRQAGAELETREGSEWGDLVGQFEVRQVVQALSQEGGSLNGATAEVVEEMRSSGNYKGVPVPYEALEVRNTVAAGVPDPRQTAPIIDRLFADSVATTMGGQMINIPFGEREWPVVTSDVTAAWAATEGGDVAAAVAFTTVDKPMAPDSTLGVQMKLSRKAMLQTGPALEQAVRRDLASAIRVKLDEAFFLGTGATGEPLGVIAGAATYGITETPIAAPARYSAFRSAAVRFMLANAANGPGAVSLMLRPEVFDTMDETLFDAGSGVTEWDRLVAKFGSVTMSSNALAEPTGTPPQSTALLTTRAGGVAPFFAGLWGGVDMIRDVYTGAASGSVTITGLVTADVTVARPEQIEVLTEVE